MKIGFTCGAFDLFHAGHVLMLKECKDKCDYLIVGLHSDPTLDRHWKLKPIQTMYERYVQLSGSKYVNEIIPYETEKDLENLLSSQTIHIRFLGGDYLDKDATGLDICVKKDIDIIYTSRLHNWSSTALKKRIIDAQSNISGS